MSGIEKQTKDKTKEREDRVRDGMRWDEMD